MANQDIPHVLTIDAAAKLYEGTSFTPAAIRRLVRSGEIPSRRVGAKYLIVASAIEEWLQGESGRLDSKNETAVKGCNTIERRFNGRRR